jgi:hypothetical protein
MSEEETRHTRGTPQRPRPTRFLCEAGAWIVERCRPGTSVFAYQFLSPNVLYEPSPIVNAGKPEGYPEDFVTLDVNSGIYLIHTKEGFFALSAICTHLGCMTAWKPELGIITCPCHGRHQRRLSCHGSKLRCRWVGERLTLGNPQSMFLLPPKLDPAVFLES